MSDFSKVGRALFAVAGSALVLGSVTQTASADDFDGQHMSVNQGTECALRDVGEVGENVLATGALPKTFNNVDTTSGRTDGIKALCHAVQPTPPGPHRPQGLLGGLRPGH